MFLIIKNIFKIHVFFYIFMFIAFITGNIRDYLFFSLIIIVHECGHILGGFLFSWKIKKIILLPFGGLTIFDQPINTSMFSIFIVTLLGPLFQIVFTLLLLNFFSLSNRILYYDFLLLFFNLLPIYPLDGSKFLNIILCILFPFKYGHLALIFISFFCIFLIFCFVGHFDLIIFLILFFLIVSVYREFLNHKFIFNKFLFERFSNNYYFKHIKYIKSVDGMYLWRRHLFDVDGFFLSERNYLSKRFDKYYKLW